MDERTALYLLNTSVELWVHTISAMRLYAGSYAEALTVPAEEYRQAGILKNTKKVNAYEGIRRNRDALLRQMEDYEQEGIRIVTHMDDAFPRRLQQIPDAPLMLYVRGVLPEENLPTAAIVGARECSEYGISVAEYFGRELSARGVQIISGMAYGIDAAAGRGALAGNGRSYAVLGTGVNVCYPKESFRLYEAMCGGKGGVISEFAPGEGALGQHFVMRNRLIAGLGDALLVIEAREKSGTSITVGYALDQGKDVFALPGRITDPLGYGCNRLLKEGAMPLTSPSDVLEYFGLEGDGRGQMTMGRKDLSQLTHQERQVYTCLREEAAHVEDICAACGLPLRETLTVLYSLEHKGYALNTSSAYYRRCW